MAQIFLKNLPYQSSSAVWFEALTGANNRIWLDSSDSPRGRFDILTADPEKWHVFDPGSELNSEELRRAAIDFLDTLRIEHTRARCATENANIPFIGGVIGQLTYDFGRCLMNIESNKQTVVATPLAEAGVYNWAIVQDHRQKRCTFVSLESTEQAISRCDRLSLALTRSVPRDKAELTTGTRSNLAKEDYRTAFAQIREYTLDGDCYQINFSKQYSANYDGDPAALYQDLRAATSGPFSAFFEASKSTTLSLSPERLVSIRRKHLLTQPIKGTAPRSSNAQQDHARAADLENSEKNRAENVMIVDLLRNDFGKVSRPGSIDVPQLFELQSFSAVHHLVSSIQGELAHDKDAFDVLQALFPGGSVTGAPKRRAMEIIEELEPHQRSAYCGSIFYFSNCGKFDSSILIRSVLCEADELHCWGGGGIVLDSTVDEEWDEIQDKIGNLLKVLNATRR